MSYLALGLAVLSGILAWRLWVAQRQLRKACQHIKFLLDQWSRTAADLRVANVVIESYQVWPDPTAQRRLDA